jgi:ATP-dependent protease HslVU (ClpYQ) ATPase subunit
VPVRHGCRDRSNAQASDERLFDQTSFDAPEMGGRKVQVGALVRERLEAILQDQDLSRFIL